MRIAWALIITSALLLACCIAPAKEISGGKEVVIIGMGQDRSGERAPEWDSFRSPSPRFYIDASSPAKVNETIPPFPPTPDDKAGIATGAIHPFLFVSISTVTGTGDFSAWRSLGEVEEVGLKQTSSGRRGNLESDNRLLLTNEVRITPESNKSIIVISRDEVRFSGSAYREIENYKNNFDRIKNSFDAYSISKESMYLGRLSYIDSEEYTTLNRSLSYDQAAAYVGRSELQSRMGSGNGSCISEVYQGAFTLTRRISNSELMNQTKPAYNWMSWEDKPVYNWVSW